MDRRILCYGDSNTWGCIPRWKDLGIPSDRYGEAIRWPARLARLLDCQVIEEGLGGRTTMYEMPGESWRNGLTYLDPCLRSHRPLDLVVLMLGTNDLQDCFRLTVERMGDGVRALVGTVRAVDFCGRERTAPPVLVVAPTLIKAGQGRTEVYGKYGCDRGGELSRHFAEVYRQAAEDLDCYFLDAALYAAPSDADGLHWMPESHIRFAGAAAEKIREIFGERA